MSGHPLAIVQKRTLKISYKKGERVGYTDTLARENDGTYLVFIAGTVSRVVAALL